MEVIGPEYVIFWLWLSTRMACSYCLKAKISSAVNSTGLLRHTVFFVAAEYSIDGGEWTVAAGNPVLIEDAWVDGANGFCDVELNGARDGSDDDSLRLILLFRLDLPRKW